MLKGDKQPRKECGGELTTLHTRRRFRDLSWDSWRVIISWRNFQWGPLALAHLGRNYVSPEDYHPWAKTLRTQLEINKLYSCLPWQQHFLPCVSVLFPLPVLPAPSDGAAACRLRWILLFFWIFWRFIKRGRINPSLHLFDMKHPAGSQMDLCLSSICMAYIIVPITMFTVPWLYLRTMNWCRALGGCMSRAPS